MMINRKLRGLHILFLLTSVPYGFISYLSGIVPGVYDSLAYQMNLFAIVAYDLFALIGIIKATKQGIDEPLNFWLVFPFIFFALGAICFINLLLFPSHPKPIY